jgi:hypothetical protein
LRGEDRFGAGGVGFFSTHMHGVALGSGMFGENALSLFFRLRSIPAAASRSKYTCLGNTCHESRDDEIQSTDQKRIDKPNGGVR